MNKYIAVSNTIIATLLIIILIAFLTLIHKVNKVERHVEEVKTVIVTTIKEKPGEILEDQLKQLKILLTPTGIN